MTAERKYTWSLEEPVVRNMLDRGFTNQEIAARFGVSRQAVSRYLKRRGWRPILRRKRLTEASADG